MAGPETPSEISLDVIARLVDTIENLETMPSDQVLVVLNESLDVIRELVVMLDEQRLLDRDRIV